MPMGVTPDWNNLLNKPSVVNSVNGNSGAVSAAQVSAAATSGYGYTPASSAHNHSGVYVAVDNGHNAVGSMVFGYHGAAAVSAGSTLAGSSVYAASVNGIGSTLSGTWRCLGIISSTLPDRTCWQRIA
jgi:hypothetical protein